MTEQTIAQNNRPAVCRQKAEQRLTAEVEQLLLASDDGRSRWTGSKADLYEAIYVAWDTHLIRDEATGSPMLLKQMMVRVCRLMSVAVPANPYSMARRAARRKGVKAASYMERYTHMLEHGNDSPLRRCVRRADHSESKH
ncbi:MAG: hypothetical protein K5928_06305 [Prevotella sp.]|nr:hypothetical protein [Prevotella sp.]